MGFFQKRTVGDIVAPITRIVSELKDHADKHVALAERHGDLIDHHEVQARLAADEAKKATQTAATISALVQ